MHFNKSLKYFIPITLLVIFYSFFNPREWSFFPKCPLYHYTGLKCSGCGSQRAIHDILHLDFVSAFHENALILFAIPYAAFGFYLDQKKVFTTKQLLLRKKLYGITAIWVVLVIVVAYAIARNL
ncbi:MAG: hypothetical protein CVT96_02080 [Bacteroidetes bacterium HGW-Bacteroidetes-13]|jgi:hypothetical protein|nr:MAG: hypothetical protein CVT96_02080 [Bacteroidetes bacterium HGW-Bacteroidetes-13]